MSDNFLTGHFENVERRANGIIKTNRSVLQDWVMELVLREQGTLLTAIRGCDLVPKYPVDSVERQLTAFIRCHVMIAFDVREIDYCAGAFMQSRFDESFKPSQFGHYPLHYVSHLIHALEIISVRHPDMDIRIMAYDGYERFVKDLHLNLETPKQMSERLSDDRIAANSVVQ